VSCFFFLKKKKNQGMQLQLVHWNETFV
jgi:hypothetical protein